MGFHAKNCENLTLADYYRKHILGEKVLPPPPPLVRKPFLPKPAQPADTAAGGVGPHEKSYKSYANWIDQCGFTCKICQAQFRSRSRAFEHVGQVHNMDMTR